MPRVQDGGYRITAVAVCGRVRDAATGDALSGARVILGLRLGQPDEVRVADAKTTAEGLFHLIRPPRLTDGTYDLGVMAGGYWPLASPAGWQALQPVALAGGSPAGQSFSLRPITRLAVRVLTAAGAARSGARLRIAPAGGGASLITPEPTTDDHGAWALTDGPADTFGFGAYATGNPTPVNLEVSAQDPDTMVWSAPIPISELRPGDSRFVLVRLA